MGANVEHDFQKGFLLGEEQLRRLHDIVQRRAKAIDPNFEVNYRVSRGDSYSYITNSVQDVVNEDNEDWRAISSLDVIVFSQDSFDFKLNFSKRGISLRISGDDRDSVFLLFSDLREYIGNEVLVRRWINPEMLTLFWPIFSMILVVGLTAHFLPALVSGADPAEYKKALQSSDVLEKLNFILSEKEFKLKGMNNIFYLMFLMVPVMFGGRWVVMGLDSIFPTNVFLFGKRKVVYEKRQKLLANFFWVIVVGAAVSTIAGLFVWKVTV